MLRILTGALAAAVAMFVAGFIFYGTPLYHMSTGSADVTQQAEVQRVLAANLPATGTYHVPDANSPEATVMYGKGPIATIHYNAGGFSVGSTDALVYGFLLYLLVALLIGAALSTLGNDRSMTDRIRTGTLFAIATSAMLNLSGPIWYHFDWGHFLYRFVIDALILSLGAAIIGWMMEQKRAGPEPAPVAEPADNVVLPVGSPDAVAPPPAETIAPAPPADEPKA